MKFKIGVVLFLVAIILSACWGQKTIHFNGESNSWEVEYIADVQSTDSESTSIKMRYVGEGEPPENINYAVDSGTGGSEGSNISLDNGVLHTSGDYCSGCAVTSEDDDINVVIEWNGRTEEVNLEN